MNVIIEFNELRRLSDRIEALEDALLRAVHQNEDDDWRTAAMDLLTQDEEAGELEPQPDEPVQCPNCGRSDTTVPLSLPEEPANHFHHCRACGNVWTDAPQ